MTFGSILMDIPDTERLFCHYLVKPAAGLQLVCLALSSPSLQPGLAWSSVGSHLTNQPPTGDVFDSSGFLMKWTLSACRENYVYWPLAGDRDPASVCCVCGPKCAHTKCGHSEGLATESDFTLTILGFIFSSLSTIIYGKGAF